MRAIGSDMAGSSQATRKSARAHEFERAPPVPHMLIGGRCVLGQGSPERIVNPATGEVIGSVPEATPGQIEQAAQAAKQAFASWKRTPARERAACLLAMASRIEAHITELAQLESYNCGKPYALMLSEEM